MHRDSIISIDMGGTKVLGCVVNSKEGIIARVKKPTDTSASRKKYVHQLAEVVNELIEETTHQQEKNKSRLSRCARVPVDPVTGVIGIAPNLGLKNFNIKKIARN